MRAVGSPNARADSSRFSLASGVRERRALERRRHALGTRRAAATQTVHARCVTNAGPAATHKSPPSHPSTLHPPSHPSPSPLSPSKSLCSPPSPRTLSASSGRCPASAEDATTTSSSSAPRRCSCISVWTECWCHAAGVGECRRGWTNRRRSCGGTRLRSSGGHVAASVTRITTLAVCITLAVSTRGSTRGNKFRKISSLVHVLFTTCHYMEDF
jgi:hypothetical protein